MKPVYTWSTSAPSTTLLILRQAGKPNEPNPIIEHQPALPDPSAEEISPPPDQDEPTEPNPS